MDIIEPYYRKKILVIQNNHIYSENLGDGDMGYTCDIEFNLYSSVPNIIFDAEDWIPVFGYIYKELESVRFESTNSLWMTEFTEEYDVNKKIFVEGSPFHAFSYPVVEEPIINQFRNKRIINILNYSKSPYNYEGLPLSLKGLKTYWGDMHGLNLTPESEGCPYKINLMRDTNVLEMPLPSLLVGKQLQIYLDLGIESIVEDYRDVVIFSNIENIYNFIPHEFVNQIAGLAYSDCSLSRRLITIVETLNSYMEYWGESKNSGWHPEPLIKFFVGNRVVCKYKIFVSYLNQKYHVSQYIETLKSLKW